MCFFRLVGIYNKQLNLTDLAEYLTIFGKLLGYSLCIY